MPPISEHQPERAATFASRLEPYEWDLNQSHPNPTALVPDLEAANDDWLDGSSGRETLKQAFCRFFCYIYIRSYLDKVSAETIAKLTALQIQHNNDLELIIDSLTPWEDIEPNATEINRLLHRMQGLLAF